MNSRTTLALLGVLGVSLAGCSSSAPGAYDASSDPMNNQANPAGAPTGTADDMTRSTAAGTRNNTAPPTPTNANNAGIVR